MMKRFICIIFLILLLTMLPGCGKNKNPNNGEYDLDDGISVVSTIFTPYDFTREIAGDKADITMLLPPASESHSYEPTPKDIITIQNCDIFIYVGGESDQWVEQILDSVDITNMNIIALTNCVSMVEEEIVEGMDEGGEEEDAAYDEHVWTSPKNAKQIVQSISDTLCEVDKVNESVYIQNTKAYLEQLEELDFAFKEVVDNAVRKTIIFGDRFPFRYLADAYGLTYFAAFPGCSTETEASVATVTYLIDKIKEEAIPVIFHVELSNEKMADTISESTGAKKLLLHACHNISKDDFEKGVSYLELMKRNVSNLKEALQ